MEKLFFLYFSSFAKQNQAEIWPRVLRLFKLLLWTKDVEWVKWFNAILFCSLCNDTVEPNHNGPRKKSHPSPQKVLVFQWVDFKLHQVKALFVLKIAKQNAKLQLKEIEIEWQQNVFLLRQEADEDGQLHSDVCGSIWSRAV